MTVTDEPVREAVDGNGVALSYVARGPLDAPAIILVHGIRDHARSWDPIAEALCDRFRVIAPDLRGHGESGWAGPGGYSIAMFFGDLADLIDDLRLPTVAIVGHSLGGAIAVRYAAVFPERVRALCAIEAIELPIVRDELALAKSFPVRLRDWITLERDRRRRSPRIYSTRAAAEARMAEQHPGFDAALIAHIVAHGVVGDDTRGWRWKYDNVARYRAPEDADGRDLDAVLAAISCPTLLAYGDASWIPVPAAERLALIRQHHLVRFAGVGHWLHQQSRTEFLAALERFLKSAMQGQLHA